MTKLIALLFLFIVAAGLSITIMVYGYGVPVKSWPVVLDSKQDYY